MENAAEALKMAFAVLVFVIALSLGFMMISQARATADVVYEARDKQDYVDGVTATTVSTDDDGNKIEYRIVGLDTVIPTIYRYAQESYAVTIIDGNTIKARFDIQTENIASSEFNLNGNHGQGYKNLAGASDAELDADGKPMVVSIENRIKSATGKRDFSISNYDELMKTLYSIEGVSKPYAPWTSSPYNIMRRLKKDIYGGTEQLSFNTNEYKGVFNSKGLIGTYPGGKFREYYYTIQEKNHLSGEKETKKLEIIYEVIK